MGKENGKIKQMINGLPKWSTPCPGKSLTLREWLLYAIGGMGAMGATVFLNLYALQTGFYIANARSIDAYHIAIVVMITSVVAIVTSPLVSWLIDNTNTKYGKFRPYLIVLPIPIIACFFALGQVLRIEDSLVMIITYAILFNLVNLFNRVYILAFVSLAQVMAPSMEERTQLMSIGSIFTSLGPTIVWAVYPALSNIIYSTDTADGVNTVATAQVLAPIMAAVFFGLGLIMAFGVKERMVISKEFKQKQKFMEGVQKVAKNKYFWIHNSSMVLAIIKVFVMTNFVIWYLNFVISPDLKAQGLEDLAKLMQSILMLVIGTASVPGMLFAPVFIKKFGKKKLIIGTNIGMALSMIPLTFVHNPWAGIFFIYVTTIFAGFQLVINPAFQAEINDYQQYKTGDRIEGFLSQFGGMITLAIGMATALISPAVFNSQGYDGMNNDILLTPGHEALYAIVAIMSGVCIVSCLLSAIPYFFWDLPEKKHEMIMEVLKVRALHDDETISDEDRDMLEIRLEEGDINALSDFIEENGIVIDNESITVIDETLDDQLLVGNPLTSEEIIEGMDAAALEDADMDKTDEEVNAEDASTDEEVKH